MASEDSRTLWIGNLDDKVTEELIYELLLQSGPIERLVFPTEGEGDDKKHKGHAYIVFEHKESVQYATQIFEGTELFSQTLSLKARSLPITYKTETPASTFSNQNANRNNNNRFNDNSSLRGGFNRGSNIQTYIGGRGGYNNYNSRYNNFNNTQVVTPSTWIQGSNTGNLEEKRQRLLNAQNLTLNTHQQMQQQAPYVQQQQWSNTTMYSMGTGNMTSTYQYAANQYSPWYPRQ